MEEEKKQNDTIKKLKEQVEEKLKTISDNGIKIENLENLYKLIDIHKDILNEEYWEGEMNEMRYGNYDDYYENDTYGRRQRDSRGRYMEGSYGRRGVPGSGRGRYRGHDYLEDMYETYGEYAEDNEYGNYGATTKELEKMLDCNIALIDHLKKNAKSQEEMQIIERKVQEMSRI